jgi:hypothetical protein
MNIHLRESSFVVQRVATHAIVKWAKQEERRRSHTIWQSYITMPDVEGCWLLHFQSWSRGSLKKIFIACRRTTINITRSAATSRAYPLEPILSDWIPYQHVMYTTMWRSKPLQGRSLSRFISRHGRGRGEHYSMYLHGSEHIVALLPWPLFISRFKTTMSPVRSRQQWLRKSISP